MRSAVLTLLTGRRLGRAHDRYQDVFQQSEREEQQTEWEWKLKRVATQTQSQTRGGEISKRKPSLCHATHRKSSVQLGEEPDRRQRCGDNNANRTSLSAWERNTLTIGYTWLIERQTDRQTLDVPYPTSSAN